MTCARHFTLGIRSQEPDQKNRRQMRRGVRIDTPLEIGTRNVRRMPAMLAAMTTPSRQCERAVSRSDPRSYKT